MIPWNRTDRVMQRLELLERGQATILARVDQLGARDTELESKISAAMDRMTAEMAKQSSEFRETLVEQTQALRDSLIETRVARRLVVITGRGLRWAERGAWVVAAALCGKIWIKVAHVQGWDGLWWWPW